MERLAPGRGTAGPEFWNSRARRFAATLGTGASDPFYGRVGRRVGRRSTVLDVGAGAGRFALALAPRVEEVVAVDQSRAMLNVLRREARRLGLANVRTVLGRWEEVDAPPADVVICSYVLPLVEDVAGFVRKLDATARRTAFVYLGALGGDSLLDPFWRHFHGRPRRPLPTYLDAVSVLEELGIAPHVEVVEVPTRSRFADLRQAVADYRDYLLLPNTPDVRRRLRALLASWLVEQDGALRPPVRTLPAAILSWTPTARAQE